MSKVMLINTVEGHECRIAVVENGHLEELHVERVSKASRVGNIYKGKVTNVEAGIQAAFVDFGNSKNGFLHISDVHPQYFPHAAKATEAVGRKRSHRDRPPIQECLRRGQELVVQMTKEGIGTKGPTLTTYLSIPGRLLVMMPGMSRLGVSRKVEDEQCRNEARKALDELTLPPNMGFIIRTAGINRPKRELQRDLHYLVRLWDAISKHINSSKAPCEIYQESDLVTRTLRDAYDNSIERIFCDRANVAKSVREFLNVAMPRSKFAIDLYTGKEGLFHEFGLEDQIEQIYSRKVQLASGGWLAIDQTEALVAIDVNSGKFREHRDAETTATKINLEAAEEIARQLRLRDLGGVIIIDFIDMREDRNRRAVERALRDAMKNDRAKNKVLKISALGIVEMTRQRVRPSLQESLFRRCSACDGMGKLRSEESQALAVMRSIQRAISNDDVTRIDVSVTLPVEHFLSNSQRLQLAEMEQNTGKRIMISANTQLGGDEVKIACYGSRGTPVAWDRPAPKGGHQVPAVSIEEALHLKAEPYEGPAEEDFEAEAPAPPAPQKQAPITAASITAEPVPAELPAEPPGQAPAGKSRRRGRRGGRKHKKGDAVAEGVPTPPAPAVPVVGETAAEATAESESFRDEAATEAAEQIVRFEDLEEDTYTALHEPSAPADTTPPPPQWPSAVGEPSAVPPGSAEVPRKKSRRRGRRGGRRHRKDSSGANPQTSPAGHDANHPQAGQAASAGESLAHAAPARPVAAAPAPVLHEARHEPAPPPTQPQGEAAAAPAGGGENVAGMPPKKKSRRRGRRGGRRHRKSGSGAGPAPAGPIPEPDIIFEP